MNTKRISAVLTLIVACALLLSFIKPAGGEGFEIYVDNTLVLRQFNQEMKQLKNIQLTASNSKSVLKVKFYHCGMTGKSRVLELKTSDQKTLKHWQFKNEEGKNFGITVAIKDILDSQKQTGSGALYLYYASKETPEGRLLAGIVGANATAKK
ncbi:hypothetical protein ESA94_03780 [Lacibacter luteus]|uniref:Uncharacterized protein n=1 Tax=Lacibacter luteus TaxID=2508719 RepID=A0A4Q1CMW6_9BACT|nr:hypothetical protein [Lacibacter luteus]RXK62144.1 hypothetical protein ESA94_03780 [Lacibacter luteus]